MRTLEFVGPLMLTRLLAVAEAIETQIHRRLALDAWQRRHERRREAERGHLHRMRVSMVRFLLHTAQVKRAPKSKDRELSARLTRPHEPNRGF